MISNLFILVISTPLFIACGIYNHPEINDSKIEKVIIDQNGDLMELPSNQFSSFAEDYNTSQNKGPLKCIKTHWIYIHYVDNSIDSILTSGTCHQQISNGKSTYYSSEVDIIDKYFQNQ